MLSSNGPKDDEEGYDAKTDGDAITLVWCQDK